VDKDKAPAYWAVHGGYAQALTAAGILRGDGSSGQGWRQDGSAPAGRRTQPVAASDLELGAHFIIEVADLTTALEWAKKSPGIATGAVEVKPHFVNPTMAAE